MSASEEVTGPGSGEGMTGKDGMGRSRSGGLVLILPPLSSCFIECMRQIRVLYSSLVTLLPFQSPSPSIIVAIEVTGQWAPGRRALKIQRETGESVAREGTEGREGAADA